MYLGKITDIILPTCLKRQWRRVRTSIIIARYSHSHTSAKLFLKSTKTQIQDERLTRYSSIRKQVIRSIVLIIITMIIFLLDNSEWTIIRKVVVED
jgi:hypothetical protein